MNIKHFMIQVATCKISSLHSAFCKHRVKKCEEKKGSRIHASQSPVGYYHVLNCELQTQAVLKQEEKEKADGFFLHLVKLFLNASVCSLLPSWHSHANDPFSVILRKILDPHPTSHSKC